jgi:enamine deaminase RidA (YjgF/YER057c/UK114 family)
MSATAINPASVRATTGYSHAKVRAGVPVFLTGQVAWDLGGAVVGPGDIALQVRTAWDNVQRVLDELGVDVDDIVKLTTYATDPRFMRVIGAEKERRFQGHTLPASTFLVVAGLADPDLLVEVEATVMLRPGHPALVG